MRPMSQFSARYFPRTNSATNSDLHVGQFPAGLNPHDPISFGTLTSGSAAFQAATVGHSPRVLGPLTQDRRGQLQAMGCKSPAGKQIRKMDMMPSGIESAAFSAIARRPEAIQESGNREMKEQGTQLQATEKGIAPIKASSCDAMFGETGGTFDSITRRACELFAFNRRQFAHDVDNWFRAKIHPTSLEFREANGTHRMRAKVPSFDIDGCDESDGRGVFQKGGRS